MQFRSLGRTHESIPVVGLGTWGIGGEMGPDSSRDEVGIQALRLGLNLEMKLIDTAEMYGAGHTEEVVARALEGRGDRVFVASKVSPRHFAYDDVLAAAKRRRPHPSHRSKQLLGRPDEGSATVAISRENCL